MSRGGIGTRIFVGNLPPDIRESEIKDVFRKYGKIVQMDLRNKSQTGPPFAFVDFDDSRDADDAVRARDGYELDGYRIRVEFPRAYRNSDGRFVNSRGGDRDRRGGDRRGDNYPSRNTFNRHSGNSMRRSKYRVNITGLPISGSWQDLKDHMREAGDVCFADVNKDGTGVVEYIREDDMKYAIKKLDDSKFRSHEGDTSYIRVKAAEGNDSRRSRSRSGSPAGRSRSRSPVGRSKRDSPRDEPGSDRDSKRVKREASRSRSRSSHSKSRSRSKTPASRSPSQEKE
ncbi:serine/arginine-rich splicing factor 1B-like [Paramacrobiotus metropolitanus]|uniref:serine/arginine-rich splicing factor 1B-like n=1 Tax=Paramacrobiotus metropolitanus TaxID=2943436 RepID=UPI002445A60B|nr:serine/arginine-rich splicing factor 1B-like [Paramacrobiotus metropolitanus]